MNDPFHFLNYIYDFIKILYNVVCEAIELYSDLTSLEYKAGYK